VETARSTAETAIIISDVTNVTKAFRKQGDGPLASFLFGKLNVTGL
jgi:predicted molibdopterin-dependent oxidoreductase YjgC